MLDKEEEIDNGGIYLVKGLLLFIKEGKKTNESK